MVILDRYRAVFIEVPRTGSEAVRQELMSQYGGRSEGSKHSFKIPDDCSGYDLFYGVSDPIDRTYSKYLKYKNNPLSYFMHHGNWPVVKYMMLLANLPAYFLVRVVGIGFENYLRLFMPLAFVDPSNFIAAPPRLLLRKENLSSDFKDMLRLIGAIEVRPLPRVNETAGKSVGTKDKVPNYDRDSMTIGIRFNMELEKSGYPFKPIGSRPLRTWAYLAYHLAFQFKRMTWKIMRG